jgi:urease accessory protein
MTQTYLEQLQLLQLADTALPIGSVAHSFGLETFVAEGVLTIPQLPAFFREYLIEVGTPEGLFCRAAYRANTISDPDRFKDAWMAMNMRLSAMKLARESRAASGMLGKRFLQLVYSLEERPIVALALETGRQARLDLHHAPAFGLVGGMFEFGEEVTLLAYLQQMVAGLISACQRLMPLGQRQAAQLLWQLKPTLIEVAQQSQDGDLDGAASFAFAALSDLAAMRHPGLPTRLFIS